MKKEKIAILHHGSDMDGMFSGLYAARLFSGEIKMFPVEYGEPFDHQLLHDYDCIVITDFSYDPDTMMTILEAMDDRFYWFDHHYMAIEDSKEFHYDDIPGHRKVGYSAVKCIFEYAYWSMSRLSTLLDAYDIHDIDGGHYDDAIALNYYLGSLEQSNLLEVLIKDDSSDDDTHIDGYIEHGNQMRKYQISKDKRKEPIHALLGGHLFTAYNGYSPELLTVSGQERIAMFSVSGDKVKFSLRSLESDVSTIARAFGGGGHKNAAGFNTNIDGLRDMINTAHTVTQH